MQVFNEFLKFNNHILFCFTIEVEWHDIQSGLEIGDETQEHLQYIVT
jgi:hypothetical protein